MWTREGFEVLLVRAGLQQIPTNLGTSWHGFDGKNATWKSESKVGINPAYNPNSKVLRFIPLTPSWYWQASQQKITFLKYDEDKASFVQGRIWLSGSVCVKPGLTLCLYMCVDMRSTNHVLVLNLLLTLHFFFFFFFFFLFFFFFFFFFFFLTRLDDMRPQPRQLTCCCKTTFRRDCSEPPEFFSELSRQFTYQASSRIKAAGIWGRCHHASALWPMAPGCSSPGNKSRQSDASLS